jgi:hypothetical protein
VEFWWFVGVECGHQINSFKYPIQLIVPFTILIISINDDNIEKIQTFETTF